MIDFWNKRNKNEKVMLAFILLMLIVVALNWKDVAKGLQDGMNNKKTDKTLVE